MLAASPGSGAPDDLLTIVAQTPDVRDTKDQLPHPQAVPAKKAERPSGSFLVRVWLEPREIESEEPTVRGFVRNLQTGEEQYVRDPRKVGEIVLRYLRGLRSEAGTSAERQSRRK
ncbi:MAG TPA: hypothetical protein VF756_25800 [Thermoanaerobaculia bacterium]